MENKQGVYFLKGKLIYLKKKSKSFENIFIRMELINTVKISANNIDISLNIRKSRRARRVLLHIDPLRGPELVIPRGVNVETALLFANTKKDWLLRNLPTFRDSFKEFYNGCEILYLGSPISINVKIDKDTKPSVIKVENTLVLSVSSGEIEKIKELIINWYKKELFALVSGKAEVLSQRLGVKFNRIVIKKHKRLWGSCSEKGNLNFSWKLCMAPVEILDYLVTHEVAHLKYLDHSKEFWALVENNCPLYKNHKRWLKENGYKLII